MQFQLLRNANFISSFTFFVLPLSSDHFKKLQIDLAISQLLEPYQGQGHEKAYMIALPRCRPIQRALKYMEMKVRVLKTYTVFFLDTCSHSDLQSCAYYFGWSFFQNSEEGIHSAKLNDTSYESQAGFHWGKKKLKKTITNNVNFQLPHFNIFHENVSNWSLGELAALENDIYFVFLFSVIGFFKKKFFFSMKITRAFIWGSVYFCTSKVTTADAFSFW